MRTSMDERFGFGASAPLLTRASPVFGSTSASVDDGPTSLTSSGMIAEPMDPEKCIGGTGKQGR